MIVDRMRNAHLYYGMGEKFEAALRYLATQNFNEVADGTYPIRGEAMYLRVARYVPDVMSEKRQYEAHRKYYDVQYVASGHEAMGYAPLDRVAVTEPYKEDGDYLLGTGPLSLVDAPQGMFFILGPEDAHIPGLASPQTTGQVLKAVMKVAVA